jgi:Mce-associated membrane protein
VGSARPSPRAKIAAIVAIAVIVVLGVGAGLRVWLGSSGDPSPSSSADDRGNGDDRNGGASESNEVESSSNAPEGPIADDQARHAVTESATEFVTALNTYGPDGLDADDHLVEYRKTADLMSDDFAAVFEENVPIAEQTVAELGVESVATVYGTGVSAIDESSAVALVGGTIELSYPSDDSTVSSGPRRFRYVVSLVRGEDDWLVDDVDDLDDGLPPFGEPATTKHDDYDEAPAPTPTVSADHWTGQVVAAAQVAVPTVFSYDYRTFDADLASADQLLTSDFADRRNALFDDGLRAQVLRQQVVVMAETTAVGLGAGDAETAQAFVFIDQVTSKKASKDQTLRMWATLVLVREGDEWLVDDVLTGG